MLAALFGINASASMQVTYASTSASTPSSSLTQNASPQSTFVEKTQFPIATVKVQSQYMCNMRNMVLVPLPCLIIGFDNANSDQYAGVWEALGLPPRV
eukprot:IDg20886t1